MMHGSMETGSACPTSRDGMGLSYRDGKCPVLIPWSSSSPSILDAGPLWGMGMGWPRRGHCGSPCPGEERVWSCCVNWAVRGCRRLQVVGVLQAEWKDMAP